MSEHPSVEQFYEHLGECECWHMPYFRCKIGQELLLEAAEHLPEEWQREAGRLIERRQREKEADANFRFYANSEEP